mgnify:FL=1
MELLISWVVNVHSVMTGKDWVTHHRAGTDKVGTPWIFGRPGYLNNTGAMSTGTHSSWPCTGSCSRGERRHGTL